MRGTLAGKKGTLVGLLLCCLFLWPLPARGGSRVLLLHAYHEGHTWTDRVHRSVIEAFEASDKNISLLVEYLDARRAPGLFLRSPYREQMRCRYLEREIDLILVDGDEALDFVLRGRGDFLPDLPVVFCGVTSPRDIFRERPRALAGTVSDYDLEGTINLALSLHPESRAIAAICDLSPAGRWALGRLRDIEPRFAWQADLIPLVDLSLSELRDAVMALPEGTLLLYLSFSGEGGEADRPEELAGQIAQWRPELPLYTPWASLIESGAALGGRVILPEEEGSFLAETALEILSGEAASSLPIRWSSPKVDLFNRDLLARFQLSPKDLPRGNLLVGGREFLYRPYSPLILALGGASLLALFFYLRNRRTESVISDQRRFLQLFIELFPLPVFYGDEARRYRHVNKLFADLVGLDRADLIGRTIDEVVSVGWSEAPGESAAEGGSLKGEIWTERRAYGDGQGGSRHLLVIGRSHGKGRGPVQGHVGVVVDLSDLKEREEILLHQEERLQKALEGAAEGVWDWDIVADSIHCRLEGADDIVVDDGGAMGLDDWRRLLHPQDRSLFDRTLDEHLRGLSSFFFCECRLRKGEGWVWIRMRGRVISRDGERPLRLTGTLLDIGEKKEIERRQKEAERELRQAAMTDRLTGTLARKYFEDLLSLQIRRSADAGGPLALIFFDLDDFRAVNTLYGHFRGDAVIASVAGLVRLHIRAGDVLGRWGGKTFSLLTLDSIDGALQLAEKLRKLIEEENFLDERRITASFGVAAYSDADDVEDLVARADEALCRAKQSGKNVVHL